MGSSLSNKNHIRSLHIIGRHLSFSSHIFALKRVQYLNDFQQNCASTILMNDSKFNTHHFFYRAFTFWKNRVDFREKIQGGINLIHVYDIIDLILLLIVMPFGKNIAVCLSSYDIKINKLLEVILKILVKRTDHFFVSSRFVTDQFWSAYDIPPSRVTVLAITKYLERKDIKLLDGPSYELTKATKKIIKVGLFIADTKELGPFSRFKHLLEKFLTDEGSHAEIYLVKNDINESFLPDKVNGDCVQTSIVSDDIDLLNLDFWVVLSAKFPCPYINDALKIGSLLIAPSTHYTSELERILGDRLSTYKPNEVSSAVKKLISLSDKIISGTYERKVFSSSSWEHERSYLLEGYEKAIRRRENLSRIS